MIEISLRKQCAMDAFREWLKRQQPDAELVDIVTPNPVVIVLKVRTEEDGPAE